MAKRFQWILTSRWTFAIPVRRCYGDCLPDLLFCFWQRSRVLLKIIRWRLQFVYNEWAIFFLSREPVTKKIPETNFHYESLLYLFWNCDICNLRVRLGLWYTWRRWEANRQLYLWIDFSYLLCFATPHSSWPLHEELDFDGVARVHILYFYRYSNNLGQRQQAKKQYLQVIFLSPTCQSHCMADYIA